MPDLPLPKPQKPSTPPQGGVPLGGGAPLPPASTSSMTPPPSGMVPPPSANAISSAPALSGMAPKPVSPVSGMTAPAPATGLFANGQPPPRQPLVQQPQQPLQPIQAAKPAQPPFPQPPAAQSPFPTKQATASPAASIPGVKNAAEPALKVAAPKSSPLSFLTGSPIKIAAIVGAVLLVIGGAVFAFSSFMGGGSQSVSIDTPNSAGSGNNQGTTGSTSTPPPVQQKTITYWGLWEQTEEFRAIITDFETQNPGIKVEYVKQNHVDYRERLQTAIASGNGPDMFRFHASWTPMLAQELDSVPDSVFSSAEYQQTFFPVAARQLQVNGKIVGIPLMYDGLGLYINTEIFRQAAMAEPTTWAELKNAAIQLTVRNAAGEVERGGLAIGNASNVEHFSDILGLLILQNGGDPSNPSTREVSDALRFYTGFYKTDRVWSDKLPTSTVAFARGEVAMMFAPSWRAHEVRAMNPDFADFKVIPTPTLGDQRVAWGTFWAEGVNSKTANKAESWKLLENLSSSDVMKSRYSEQSQSRLFGELYSRQDLAAELIVSQDAIVQNVVAPYLEDAQFARSWYMNSYTHDNGINDQIIQYYRDAINAVIGGTDAEKAMEPVVLGVPQVLRQYGAAQNQ